MLGVVAPVLHKLPAVVLLVKVTLPPEQNVVGPLALMVGIAGVPSRTRTTMLQTELLRPSVTV